MKKDIGPETGPKKLKDIRNQKFMGLVYNPSLHFLDFRKLGKLLGEELKKRKVFIFRYYQLHYKVILSCYNGDRYHPSQRHELLCLLGKLHG